MGQPGWAQSKALRTAGFERLRVHQEAIWENDVVFRYIYATRYDDPIRRCCWRLCSA